MRFGPFGSACSGDAVVAVAVAGGHGLLGSEPQVGLVLQAHLARKSPGNWFRVLSFKVLGLVVGSRFRI